AFRNYFLNFHEKSNLLTAKSESMGMQLFQEYTSREFDQIIAINTSIDAHRLAFSGEEVAFFVKIKKVISESSIVICGEAKIDSEVIADAEFELQGLKISENRKQMKKITLFSMDSRGDLLPSS
ncbi:MAG: hypothetical protein AAFY78_24930, partial [Cyanobacteria bacterium J06648_16]